MEALIPKTCPQASFLRPSPPRGARPLGQTWAGLHGLCEAKSNNLLKPKPKLTLCSTLVKQEENVRDISLFKSFVWIKFSLWQYLSCMTCMIGYAAGLCTCSHTNMPCNVIPFPSINKITLILDMEIRNTF